MSGAEEGGGGEGGGRTLTMARPMSETPCTCRKKGASDASGVTPSPPSELLGCTSCATPTAIIPAAAQPSTVAASPERSAAGVSAFLGAGLLAGAALRAGERVRAGALAASARFARAGLLDRDRDGASAVRERELERDRVDWAAEGER